MAKRTLGRSLPPREASARLEWQRWAWRARCASDGDGIISRHPPLSAGSADARAGNEANVSPWDDGRLILLFLCLIPCGYQSAVYGKCSTTPSMVSPGFRSPESLYRGNVSFIIDFVKRKRTLAVSQRAVRSSAAPPARPRKATKETTAAESGGRDSSAPMPGSSGGLGSDVERALVDGLRKQTPIKDLPGVAIENVRLQPEPAFDIAFEIRSGSQRITVFAEVKPDSSPRRLAEIAPWIQRLKSLRQDVAIAVAAPSLSPQSQAFCIENGIDFLDLAGNVFINIPGIFTLQRTGMRERSIESSALVAPVMNVFSGR